MEWAPGGSQANPEVKTQNETWGEPAWAQKVPQGGQGAETPQRVPTAARVLMQGIAEGCFLPPRAFSRRRT